MITAYQGLEGNMETNVNEKVKKNSRMESHGMEKIHRMETLVLASIHFQSLLLTPPVTNMILLKSVDHGIGLWF